MKKILFIILLGIFSSGFTYASEACFEQADNFDDGSAIGGFDKEAAIDQGYSDIQDPAMDLLGCFIQTSYEGPTSVIGHCGCLEAIKSLCKFKFDWKGVLSVSASGGASKAWCMPFIFLAY